jgi:hypothetical protein
LQSYRRKKLPKEGQDGRGQKHTKSITSSVWFQSSNLEFFQMLACEWFKAMLEERLNEKIIFWMKYNIYMLIWANKCHLRQ